MAYARDPSLVFAGSKEWGPPLAFRQPVTYAKVTLLGPVLEGHLAGERLDVVQVDWLAGTARTCADADDALNGVYASEGAWRMPSVERESVQQYVRETLELLERGHSLLDPACSCAHRLPAARCRKLGIAVERAGWCSLGRVPREVSAAELGRELCLHDPCREPALVCALERLCAIRVTEDGSLGFAPRGVYLGQVRCKADLVRKLQTHALPFEQPKNAYVGLEQDVRELEAEGALCVVSRGAAALVLHYLRPEAGRPVDADIRALWEAVGEKKRARS